MLTVIYIACAFAQMALLLWGVQRLSQAPSWSLLAILATLAFIPYDNLVIAIGSRLGEGTLLQALTWPRYAAHALLVPLWMLAGLFLAQRAGVQWVQGRAALLLVAGLAIMITGLGIVHEIVQLDLVPVAADGILTYRNAGRSGPPVAPLVTIAVLLVLGAGMLVRARWPWLLAGTLFILCMAALPMQATGSVAVNIGEAVLGLTLLLSEARFPAPRLHSSLAAVKG